MIFIFMVLQITIVPGSVRYDIPIYPHQDINYTNVFELDGRQKDVSIVFNSTITNFQLAFLRAYNLSVLFERVLQLEVNGGITSIDLEGQIGKKGYLYRSAGFRLVLTNFFKKDLDNLPEEARDKVYQRPLIYTTHPENEKLKINIDEILPMSKR